MAHKVLYALLRPIAAFCARRSIAFQEVQEALKQAMVDSATEELSMSGAKVNVSRLSVLTGLQRRDVQRLLALDRDKARAARGVMGKVLEHWGRAKRFTTSQGEPRVLSVEGQECEFVQLVESVTKGVNPWTLLAELVRIGAVQHTPRGLRRVKLGAGFIGDELGLMEVVGRDLNTLIRATEENIACESQAQLGNLHIRTHYDNVYVKDLPAIRSWIIERGREFHRQAREFLSQFDKDLSPRTDPTERAGARVTVQSFSLIEGGSGEHGSS